MALCHSELFKDGSLPQGGIYLESDFQSLGNIRSWMVRMRERDRNLRFAWNPSPSPREILCDLCTMSILPPVCIQYSQVNKQINTCLFDLSSEHSPELVCTRNFFRTQASRNRIGWKLLKSLRTQSRKK